MKEMSSNEVDHSESNTSTNWGNISDYTDYDSQTLCVTEEDLQMFGDISVNFTIDANCSTRNGTLSACPCLNLSDFGNLDFHTSMSSVEKTVLLVIYTNMALVALVMNVFIIVTIITNKLHQKVTYIFIMNLACADVFMLTVNMPISLSYIMLNNWVLGKALCHIAYPTFALPVYVSSWTMMLISLERYIVTHSKSASGMGMTRMKAIMLIGAIILVSILLAIPLMMYTKFDRPQYHLPAFIEDHRAFCIEVWPSAKAQAIYGSIIVQTQFILPVIVTIGLHAGIYKVFHNRYVLSKKRSVHSMTKYTNGRSSEELRAKKSYEQKKAASGVLLGIVVVFVICWSPTNIFMMILDTSPNIVPTKKLPLIHCVLRILATSSSCINPIFYGWSNKAFRLAALKAIKACGGSRLLCKCLLDDVSEQSITYNTTSKMQLGSHGGSDLQKGKRSKMSESLDVRDIIGVKELSSTANQERIADDDCASRSNSSTAILSELRGSTIDEPDIYDTIKPLLKTDSNDNVTNNRDFAAFTPEGATLCNGFKTHNNVAVRFENECLTRDRTSEKIEVG